jgi:hypothetical protein
MEVVEAPEMTDTTLHPIGCVEGDLCRFIGNFASLNHMCRVTGDKTFISRAAMQVDRKMESFP